jgi:RNA polymerase sigma factor (sigma-70 family)
MLGPSFPQTLAAARTGAEEAWAAIYRDLAPAILGYLRARGVADPEDVLSEALLQVVRALPSFEGDEASFRSWAFVIVHRKMIDQGRRLSRRPADPTPPEHLDSVAGNVEDEAMEGLETQRVRDLMGHLTPEQRDVLLLRVVADLSLEEVAGILGRTPGSVKALQRRGLGRLRRLLAPEVVRV